MFGTGKKKRALVVVAHPDDETLWAGGTILINADWQWWIICLCRGDDPDRRPKFFKALHALGAQGIISNLDDGPDQQTLSTSFVQHNILALVAQIPAEFDTIYTHGPSGEYTRHRRHEEVSMAMRSLWLSGELVAPRIRFFAYNDCNGQSLPEAQIDADVVTPLPVELWEKKSEIITGIYGFGLDSFEANAAGNVEAFWEFTDKVQMKQWQYGGKALK